MGSLESNLADIESQLAELSPRDPSVVSRRKLDELIDELAVETPVVRWWQRSITWQASAAAVCAVIAGLILVPSGDDLSDTYVGAGSEFIGERAVVRSVEEGSRELLDEAAWPVRQVRYDLVEEREYFDTASGVTITVLSPQEELQYVHDYSF